MFAAGAGVAGFHDPAGRPGDHEPAVLGHRAAERTSLLIGRLIGRRARGAEHRHLSRTPIRREHLEGIAQFEQSTVEYLQVAATCVVAGQLVGRLLDRLDQFGNPFRRCGGRWIAHTPPFTTNPRSAEDGTRRRDTTPSRHWCKGRSAGAARTRRSRSDNGDHHAARANGGLESNRPFLLLFLPSCSFLHVSTPLRSPASRGASIVSRFLSGPKKIGLDGRCQMSYSRPLKDLPKRHNDGFHRNNNRRQSSATRFRRTKAWWSSRQIRGFPLVSVL